MTNDANFEDRLRATFHVEAAELASRQDVSSSDNAKRSAALVEDSDDQGRRGDLRMLVPLLAAAVVLIAGIAGVIALAQPNTEAPTELTTAAGAVRPLVTATPTPIPTITVVPTLVATPEPGAEGGRMDEEPFLYVVQVGDALGLIAQRFNVTLESILAANPELDPNMLMAGQQLLIPGASEPRPPLPTAVLVTPVPTPPPLPTPTATVVPATPIPASTPAPQDPPRSGDFCMLRTIGPFAEGTCGIEAIGAVDEGWLPVQLVTNDGLQHADLVPVDALAPGLGIEASAYQPGLTEQSWCVSGIVAPDTLNVRSGPSIDRPILGELAEGQCRIYRADVPHPFGTWAWVAVDQPGGQMLTGWASSLYLEEEVQPLDDSVPRRPVLVRAESFGGPLDIPDISAFRFVDGTVLIGHPDSEGRLQIPANLDPVGLIASAPVTGDPFCAWTGSLEAVGGDGYHVLRVAMLCA